MSRYSTAGTIYIHNDRCTWCTCMYIVHCTERGKERERETEKERGREGERERGREVGCEIYEERDW